ncbi:TPA: hypothetical protein NG675_004968 [Vibrio parahaemolyticus]|nr:hypothetical protein [Vibrio parahaemolyticus]HCE2814409.1 hypothetical protein [Vibrio parahaemolyticus]HCE2818704.1 hypothetical protein [Vibrio parahaemolyticus]HCG5303159.1 hypothetical protein [Vibrio parahaemolyticus]HCG5307352.1 hypothetical protein [Vibrio parahaemolyticus]
MLSTHFTSQLRKANAGRLDQYNKPNYWQEFKLRELKAEKLQREFLQKNALQNKEMNKIKDTRSTSELP